MPMGIMSDVNARLVKREYRKCQSTFDSKSLNDLKLNERGSFFESFYFFLCYTIFLCEINLLGFESFLVNCFIHSNLPRLTFQVVRCQAQPYNKLLITSLALGTVLGECCPQSSERPQAIIILPVRLSCSVNKK